MKCSPAWRALLLLLLVVFVGVRPKWWVAGLRWWIVAKPLSLNEIRSRCAEFVVAWRGSAGEERQEAQSFVRDLLRAFGITETKAALYEKRARRSSTGGRGYIDALIPGLCLIEMKSRGRDLLEAERQALDYVDDLSEVESPRWVITCDFSTFRVLDLLAADGSDTEVFELEDLPKFVDSLAFLAGYQSRSFGSKQQETASIQAAQLMAELYEALELSGYDDHSASVFLVRTLFCLYADDAGIWERDLFLEFLMSRTSDDGSDLGAQLSVLFQVLNAKPGARNRNIDGLMARFPYVNGSVFGETLHIPFFDRSARELLIRACMFNWAQISPAIFGSLFQSVKSKEARRELGEHYTTESNILKVIEPLFMDDLRDRFVAAFHDVAGLRKLQRDMGLMRFMDPACGCGNFLIVAYREMRSLELKIMMRLQELSVKNAQSEVILDMTDFVKVKMSSFYGIELEEWPATIARTAMFLVDHQANQAMIMGIGSAPEMLPLINSATVRVGNALRVDWNEVLPASESVFVLGNPPFIGARLMSSAQKADMAFLWPKGAVGNMDYCTGWHAKAMQYFSAVSRAQFAFVTTNSIVQGVAVADLFEPLLVGGGWKVSFAHRTFAWSSEAANAANVHCVIVGFSKGRQRSVSRLFTYDSLKGDPVEHPAGNINPYLVDAPNAFVRARRQVLGELPSVSFGSMPNDGGGFTFKSDEYSQFMQDATAKKYVRKFVGADELINNRNRWCLWLVDVEPSDFGKSQLLKKRVEAVRAHREASTRKATLELAAVPHLFGEIRQPSTDYLCIPRHVSETRRFFPAARFGSEVISGDANFTAPDPDGFLFALISSSMFITWQKTVGGRIKSDLRFSNTVVWNNLPLPVVDDELRQKICDAGAVILEVRGKHPGRSLSEHYSPFAMSPELLKAHAALDRLVDKAFGAGKVLNGELERQEVLMNQYRKMAS